MKFIGEYWVVMNGRTKAIIRNSDDMLFIFNEKQEAIDYVKHEKIITQDDQEPIIIPIKTIVDEYDVELANLGT